MSFIVSNTYDIHATASLDLQFANKKSLVDQISGRNLVDHTRASSGTYVGSDGLIKTAVTNLLTYSEDFSGGLWNATSTASLSLDSILAPDGSTGVYKIISDFGVSYQVLRSGDVILDDNTIATASCFFKAGEFNSIKLAVRNKSGSYRGVVFNYDTREFSSPDSEAIDYGFTVENNGFLRVWVIIDDVGTGAQDPEFTVYPINDSTLPTAGDGTSGIYIWGAQLEQSTTVGEYIPTTSTINSAPRFDHDPTTGESLGLLVEESRTNLLPQSEFQSGWVLFNSAALTSNQALAPSGFVTAALTTSNDTTDYVYLVPSTTIGTTYTFSFFIKAGTSTRSHWHVRTSSTVAFGQINWSNGNLASLDVGTGAATFADAGNGWYRISVVYTATETNARHRIGAGDNTLTTGTAYVWGAQLEGGSFPTRYIPTEGATVTRAADVASISGSNYSGWFNASEGTTFAEYIPLKIANTTIWEYSDGTVDNSYNLRYASGSQLQTAGAVAGVNQWNIAPGGLSTVGTLYKAAVGVKSNDVSQVVGGVVRGSDTSCSIPSTSQLTIGINRSSGDNNVFTIRRLTFWSQRLPNETLQTITQ